MNTKKHLRQGYSIAGFISIFLVFLALLFSKFLFLSILDGMYSFVFFDEYIESLLIIFFFSALATPFAVFSLFQKKKIRTYGVIGGAMVVVIAFLLLLSVYENLIPPQRVRAQGASPSTPSISGSFVFRPTWTLGSKKVRAGHIFCSKIERVKGFFLFTALHLFGPSGGLPRDMSPQQISNDFRGLYLRDLFKPLKKKVVRAVPLVLQPLSAKETKMKFGDIFAFLGKDKGICSPVPMARSIPKKGESIWMAARVRGNRKTLLHRGVVAYSKGNVLYYYFDNKIKLHATSGAPILNSDGAIVAVHYGGGISGQGVYGVASSTHSIRKTLYQKYKMD